MSELTGVGQRICDARKAAGLTQRRTAEILDVSEGTVQAWEYERANLTLGRAAELSKLYNVSIDWIANGNDTVAHEEPIIRELRELIERRSAAKP